MRADCDCLPNGMTVQLVSGQHLLVGYPNGIKEVVHFPSGSDVIYMRWAKEGRRFTGIGNGDDLAWEWDGEVWTPSGAAAWTSHGLAFGPRAVIYDDNGVLQVIRTPPAVGYRYVAEDGRIVTANETIFDAEHVIWEYTYLGGIRIGQGGEGLDGDDPCIAVFDDGRRRLIQKGRCRFINVTWDMRRDLYAIAIVREDTRESLFRFLTRAELAALPEPTVPTPEPPEPEPPDPPDPEPPDPEPEPQPPDPETEPPKPMRQQVAFGPNLGSLDFQQLFTEDNLWRWSYDRISAFQFYQGHIGPIGVDLGERFCQPNTFDKLVEAQAFKKLKAAGILCELQMTGSSGPDVVHQLAARIAGAGGRLGAVCYDHMFQEISGPEFAAYVKELRADFRGMIIGAYVAYPMASLSHIRERVEVWDEFGGRPDFLRMDVDYNQRDIYTPDVHREIREICFQRGMTHQVVINAKEHISDAEYITQGAMWFDRAQGYGFDAYAVQSWASTPSEEQRQLPHNLNEGDASAHTTLVRYCLERLI